MLWIYKDCPGPEGKSNFKIQALGLQIPAGGIAIARDMFHSCADNERANVTDAERIGVLSLIARRLILSASLILETVHFRRKERASYPHPPGP
jgi:hypothetical protein